MKKHMKNIMLVAMVTTLLVPTFAFASEKEVNDSGVNVVHVSENQNVVLSDEEQKIFDEADKILKEYYEATENENTKRTKRSILDDIVNKAKGIISYGNYCGPGNNGKDPIDILDKQCYKHDKCYAKNGQWDTSCDIKFVRDLISNYSSYSGVTAKAYAASAMIIFADKAGINIITEVQKYNVPELLNIIKKLK